MSDTKKDNSSIIQNDNTTEDEQCEKVEEDAVKNPIAKEKMGEDSEINTMHQDYELIDGKYHYTDNSGQQFYFDSNKQDWVAKSTSTTIDDEVTTTKDNNSEVTTDDEGRKYYHSDGMYLCQDPEGNVYYMEDNEWKPWESKSAKENSDMRWYFYQGSDTFYRDQTTNIVYKLDKSTNQWIVSKGKVRKRRKCNDDEEFDTDESEEEEFEDSTCSGDVPPGALTDPNIKYDGSTYTKHDPKDSMTYEWDRDRRAWFPKLDEDFMTTYQLSYGFNPDGTKNENPLKYDDDDEEDYVDEKKKKLEKKEAPKKKSGWFQMDEATNTKVYVSNLPEDMTEERFIDLMSKCGLVMKDIQTNKYKVKLYKDNENRFKGDALCTYIKIESVSLALQILDGYQVNNNKIKVEKAKFQLKGSYDASLKPKKKAKKELDKLQKKQEKLFDWRPEPMRGERGKHELSVIIRNVFNPKEFEEKAELILTLSEAIRTQCTMFGEIKKLELFDRHPEGVIKVTFKDVDSADLCVTSINNRLYRDRRLFAKTWDGKEKFRIEETEEEREKRIQKWNEFLEGKNDETIPQGSKSIDNKITNS